MIYKKQTYKKLILEDGTIFLGLSFGAEKDVVGEIVFTTAMTGYQESITDQSFNGQILTFTYPLIGNYGINTDDYETLIPTAKAVVVREFCRRPNNWRSSMSIHKFLSDKNIPGISNIDTRKLTKIIRQQGTMKASIVDNSVNNQEIIKQLQNLKLPANQVKKVSTTRAYPVPNTGYNIAVIDFGLKHSILKELSLRNCQIVVLPYNTPAKDILQLQPDGIMLTNGPGDPKSLPETIKTIQQIQTKIPLFGICLGHQLFCLANGANTYQMKFGHRGLNHAVQNHQTRKIGFTSQNHGFAVDPKSINPKKLTITHTDINDKTIEGVSSVKYPAFSVQFHPDSSPGPHDTSYLFDQFIDMITKYQTTKHYKGIKQCQKAKLR
ncbi:MAG: carbamoyl phosphate synthase small subunit [Bifidobacteriaceae bacterium]|jgi:carbamoyl-phosphate synthase small subunit|nr:carbamoyl phosphate synthase small subunit [Bifidobacteriaceae bacterium]